MSNILIVYYFRKGENYWNGSLRNLDKGNTAQLYDLIPAKVIYCNREKIHRQGV
ncbi:MAG: hypothetical protein II388_01620 [Clostridia bacterium]|nr:hypothetical protein [Clostridia bacterium]